MALLASLMVVLGIVYGYFVSRQKMQLASLSALAARGVWEEGLSYFTALNTEGVRLTWIAADGSVLYDNEAAASGMENHLEREEVQEALALGFGDSERISETLAEKTLYRAERLPDGTVLRAALVQHSIWRLTLELFWPLMGVLALALALSALLARRLSVRIVKPLNALDLEHPLDNDAYEELSPLLTRIEKQRKQINSHLEELRRKQDEFAAITDNMNEGLILLNEDNAVLSINPAAARLLGVEGDCLGQDILTLERSLAMQQLVGAAQGGKHAQHVMRLDGGSYQVIANPVRSSGKTAGVALLAFDITQKAHAEQLRREFSANVSHELKTPLHTIMGTAELIENGLAKNEDIPRFAGRIRQEALRLVTLIEDIIRLSQLDEGIVLPREEVDLLALVSEAARALEDAAKTRNVVISLGGEHAQVIGTRRLLYEIAYNLMDNAIKYNKENGRVDVLVRREADGVSLVVSDTGIGIPAEYHSRVFERFYRVDKSHSRQTDGTGLGLSIVKHAAQAHNATVSLTSTPGRGTRVMLRFPAAAE